jgi:hypothetical protein
MARLIRLENDGNLTSETLDFMKTNSTLAPLLALGLLTLGGSLQAVTTNEISLKVLPLASGGTVTGGGAYTNGSEVTITANPSTNDCYVFANWTGGLKPVTNNPYTFTVTKNETLTANFALLDYTISTSSSPAKGGSTLGGGKKGCGTETTLRATAGFGFKFSHWTSSLGSDITNNPYKFTVTDNDQFVAHFADVEPPMVKITAPAVNEKIPAAAFIIEGNASDNVAVAAVYDNLNGAGWELASNIDNFAFWYTYVTLQPNSTNMVTAYAVDTSGNRSATNTVKFVCTAAGLAPLSIAGQLAQVSEGTNASGTSFVSFDSAAYVQWAAFTNNGSEVGTYTYTPTGPDTAELVPQHVLPSQDNGSNSNSPVIELTFTDAYDATFTNLSGGSGTVFITATQESVPPILDGFTLVAKNYLGTYQFTNSFDSATFSSDDNLGSNYSGTYTYTPFTQIDALLVETYTNPPSTAGTTNYLIFFVHRRRLASIGLLFFRNPRLLGRSQP